MNLELKVGTLLLTVTPQLGEEVHAEFLPDSREVVIRTPFPEALSFQVGQEVDKLTLHIANVEIRLTEEAVRQLVEKLPPEMLH